MSYIQCKSCGKTSKSYAGYCQQCYNYFIVKNFKTYKDKTRYGEIAYVDDKNSKQHSMPICHICGKAYTKLQQHIYYAHNMSKKEYCDKFGLDHNVLLTSNDYHQKMSELAYKYDMDEQLRKAGKNTRFKKGHNRNYERSYMTKERLKHYGKTMGYKNLKNISKTS